MKAVILAAGRGTRMQGLTSALPKPMLRVRGQPILEHILEGLIQAGIRRHCIVTGWRAEAIEQHFGNGARWGVSIGYARQEVQDGTGHAAEPAKPFVGRDPFLLTYGDILVRPETYQRMLRRFAEQAFSGLITVTQGDDVAKGAIDFFDESFCLRRLIEKPTPAQLEQLRQEGWLQPGAPTWYNAGIYIFRPELFDYTARLEKSVRGEYELTDAISAMVAAGHRLAGLAIEGRWVDVRDPAVLSALESGADSLPSP
jgi:bifunctional UDP-N-acetylglucosamine pyrophosphorylase/glucosamine-1-phosphate N-acetyltransferase